jgi:hypothetical protein
LTEIIAVIVMIFVLTLLCHLSSTLMFNKPALSLLGYCNSRLGSLWNTELPSAPSRSRFQCDKTFFFSVTQDKLAKVFVSVPILLFVAKVGTYPVAPLYGWVLNLTFKYWKYWTSLKTRQFICPERQWRCKKMFWFNWHFVQKVKNSLICTCTSFAVNVVKLFFFVTDS